MAFSNKSKDKKRTKKGVNNFTVSRSSEVVNPQNHRTKKKKGSSNDIIQLQEIESKKDEKLRLLFKLGIEPTMADIYA